MGASTGYLPVVDRVCSCQEQTCGHYCGAQIAEQPSNLGSGTWLACLEYTIYVDIAEEA
jgi:hypothetical protein